MIVEWTKSITVRAYNTILSMYPEADDRDFDTKYKGEVLATSSDFLGDAYFTVECTDGKVRKVEVKKCKTVK